MDSDLLFHYHSLQSQSIAVFLLHYGMLSNSDPKNTNTDDNFFDDLYKSFTINRVSASRMINSDAKKRNKINELLISNY